ncbi:Uncharacterized protein CLAVI_000273 [Candidatus Clavichlamydia salmonicola]|uniref:hypothetical protein n=1 Tax=Candidatus Clavichlamydia salmonicola TaxID=469812 RepID=UPI00189100BD|nr:hypothetical protein [Candidatus Clavichlamydia salmonicola]MBF5050659.1 Uncharacterized protein [Candidatus Clavichlamydia salmonicola]
MKEPSFWHQHSSWEDAEKQWDEGTVRAATQRPIRNKVRTPNVPLIVPSTKKWLQWKTMFYLLSSSRGRGIASIFFQRPFVYGYRFLKGCISKKKPYLQKGDFLFFGCKSVKDFQIEAQQKDTLVVVGFSYCQKPLECPRGRFNDRCCADPFHPVCRQCPIGKAIHALPKKNIKTVIIPTFHDIAEKLIELIKENSKRKIVFLITACGLSLEMFARYPQIIGLTGIGVILKGRFCNTFRTFELAERGIKPGLTILEKETMMDFMDIIKLLREDSVKPN